MCTHVHKRLPAQMRVRMYVYVQGMRFEFHPPFVVEVLIRLFDSLRPKKTFLSHFKYQFKSLLIRRTVTRSLITS